MAIPSGIDYKGKSGIIVTAGQLGEQENIVVIKKLRRHELEHEHHVDIGVIIISCSVNSLFDESDFILTFQRIFPFFLGA